MEKAASLPLGVPEEVPVAEGEIPNAFLGLPCVLAANPQVLTESGGVLFKKFCRDPAKCGVRTFYC